MSEILLTPIPAGNTSSAAVYPGDSSAPRDGAQQSKGGYGQFRQHTEDTEIPLEQSTLLLLENQRRGAHPGYGRMSRDEDPDEKLGVSIRGLGAPLQMQSEEERDWEGSLLECWHGNTWQLCLVTAFLPCVTFGRMLGRARFGNAHVLGAQFAVFFVAVQIVSFYFQIFPWRGGSIPAAVFVLYNIFMWGAIAVFTLWLAWWRSKVRERVQIQGSLFEDFCVMFWCTQCSLCQQHRTLQLNSADSTALQHSTPLTAAI